MSWRNSCPDSPIASKRSALSLSERIELFQEVLERGLDARVPVTGRSMTPFLRDGDVVTLRAVPFSSLRWGDIIFFRSADDRPVMHRIVRWRRRGGRTLVQTAGDAVGGLDPPVGEEGILAKVCSVERRRNALGGRKINMESSRWRAIGGFLSFVSLARAGFRVIAKKLGIRRRAAPDGA